MPAKVQNIRMDEDIKSKATALYADLGLTLSDAVNVFLRVSIDENGFPFPVKLRTPESVVEKRSMRFDAFLDFAKANPVFERGYTFNREACYDRKMLR